MFWIVSPFPKVMFGLMTSFSLARSGTKNQQSGPRLQVKRSTRNEILQEKQTGLLVDSWKKSRVAKIMYMCLQWATTLQATWLNTWNWFNAEMLFITWLTYHYIWLLVNGNLIVMVISIIVLLHIRYKCNSNYVTYKVTWLPRVVPQ